MVPRHNNININGVLFQEKLFGVLKKKKHTLTRTRPAQKVLDSHGTIDLLKYNQIHDSL